MEMMEIGCGGGGGDMVGCDADAEILNVKIIWNEWRTLLLILLLLLL